MCPFVAPNQDENQNIKLSKNAPVLFVGMACRGLVRLVLVVSHPVTEEVIQTSPTISCLEDETDPTFLHVFFWICVPDSQLFQLILES